MQRRLTNNEIIKYVQETFTKHHLISETVEGTEKLTADTLHPIPNYETPNKPILISYVFLLS